MRSLYNIFHSICIILYSHQWCAKVSVSPHHWPWLPLLFFFNNSHPDRCEVIAHYSFDLISLMINDSEHLFHIPIGHLYAFFEKMSIQVYSPVLIKSLFFCCWVVGASYIFWILILLSDAWFINTVSHFIGSCFTLFSLLCRNFLVWCNPTCLLLLSLQPQKTINS